MSMSRQTILASRPAAMVLALSLAVGLSTPFVMLPHAQAATQAIPAGTTELSPVPLNQIQAVPVNIAVTFDDSGSMNWNRLGDAPPWTTKPTGGLYSKAMDWGSGGNQGSGTSGGPWRCAAVIEPGATSGLGAMPMNGVYYNPNVVYTPPVYANGTSFPNADSTLTKVWVDGMTVNRPVGAAAVGNAGYNNNPDLDYPDAGSRTDIMGTKSGSTDRRWKCGYAAGSHQGQSAYWNQTSPMDGQSHTLSDGTTITYPNGGPYYYRLKTTVTVAVDQYGNPTNTTSNGTCPNNNPDCDGLHTLYDPSNWEAIPITNTNVTIGGVTVNQYQNFANWYAYYRTRNQMARTALSLVFGSPSLAAPDTATGGYGSSNLRVLWQNLNTGYVLPSSAIISALMDASGCSASDSHSFPGDLNSADPSTVQKAGTVTTPPNCYRSAFYNWIFQIPASGSTPLRGALTRVGKFFSRGGGTHANTGATGNLEDPYWQPPQNGEFNASSNPGNELYCRQNFSLLITDGLWNADGGLPAVQNLPATLPDGVSFPPPANGNVTLIYKPVHDATGQVSLSDVAMQYWYTDLRPDLYNQAQGKIVAAYLPDTRTGLFAGAGDVSFQIGTNDDGTPDNTTIPAEEYFNPKNDPATWPHMSSYMVGLGVNGILNFSENTDCSPSDTAAADQDACDLRKGIANSTGSVGWPTPDGSGNSGNGIAANIDDTWHAALAGRGQFFSAGSPQQLVTQLGSILSTIAARGAPATPAAVNASVATTGALSFQVGYRKDWSGIFQAVVLNQDGTIGSAVWDAGAALDATSASDRHIYTDSYSAGGTFAGSFAFTASNVASLDAFETAGLGTPALQSGGVDSLANRIAYLAGDQTNEANGTYRTRAQQLGAIINSQPVYVSYPNSGYHAWPAGSPEALATSGNTYDAFTAAYATRAGTVYVGANDGMLHAFNAPAPTCALDGTCTYDESSGQEDWAFVPRAVYANLGNLTNATSFSFLPTVDATPVTRDVFFSDGKWHTMLAGGVGLGGRGVYALDITGTSNSSAPATAPNKVLWEFDSDMAMSSDCVASYGSCQSSDLGYTVSQPNIGRIAAGNQWVVLVPNGYFPDCTKPEYPNATVTQCQAVAAQAPKSGGEPYSALFVLNAETGKVIAELKTPTNLELADGSGLVTSFGLATPVMGDYNGDQIDEVAFAGDLQGNLWRFDLSSASPSSWTVTLVYQGNDDGNGNQGLQSITSMPRLFPDPATNRFMVVFGTGRYLGAADNGNTATQAMIGVRDVAGTTYTQGNLTQDYLGETTASGAPAGTTLRCVTGNSSGNCASPTPVNPIPGVGQPKGGGWFINLYTTAGAGGPQNNQGERVVVSPGAIFASNTVVFETLLTGATGNDPCNPSVQGAVMAFNAVTGASAGLSSLGGGAIVGGRVNNVRTSGSLPIVSALGGGQAYLPGVTLAPAGTRPIGIDAPMWRRRSWNEINQN